MPELHPTDPGYRGTARLRRHHGVAVAVAVVVLVGALAMLVTRRPQPVNPQQQLLRRP